MEIQQGIDWKSSKSPHRDAVKYSRECGEIWKEGRINHLCFCVDCGLRVVSFNRWTPRFNVCTPCHIKRGKKGTILKGKQCIEEKSSCV